MLTAGDRLPSITLNLPGGGKLRLPEDWEDSWVYVAFFRGQW